MQFSHTKQHLAQLAALTAPFTPKIEERSKGPLLPADSPACMGFSLETPSKELVLGSGKCGSSFRSSGSKWRRRADDLAGNATAKEVSTPPLPLPFI